MPTDENNGVVTQNQNSQVNSNLSGDSVNPDLGVNQGQTQGVSQNAGVGADDDFDFNFGDDVTPNTNVNEKGNVFDTVTVDSEQNTVEDHHLFTNSDDAIETSFDNTNLFDNAVDAQNVDVQNQDFQNGGRTGMFTTPDEQEPVVQSDFADVQPMETQATESANSNPSKEALDQHIKEMFSFDGEPIEPETQEDAEAWLQQEDKNVEQAFGVQSQDVQISPDVDISSQDVAQNVENMIANENTTPYVPNENEYSQMSDLLNSSGAGQVDLTQLNNQDVNDVQPMVESNVEGNGGENLNMQNESGNMKMNDIQANQNDNMSFENNVQIEPVGVADSMSVENVEQMPTVENTQTPTVEHVEQTPVTFNINNVNPGDIEQSVGFGIGDLNSSLAGESIQIDLGNIQTETTNTQTEIPNVQTEMPNDQIETGNQNNSLNLDNIEQDIQNLSMGSQILQQETQMLNANNDGQQQQVQVQTGSQTVTQGLPVKKRKKQSGLVVLLLLFAVLGIGAFVVWKMFPDKINLDNLFKGNKVIEYLENQGTIDSEEGIVEGEGVVDVEGDGGEEGVIDEENISENVDENNIGEETQGEDAQSEDENLDPDSLAALLSQEEENTSGSDEEQTGDVSELSIEDTQETQGSQEEDENFDPFSQVGELFDENTKNSDALKNYISKGEFYKNYGIEHNNNTISRYGEYVMVTAQEQLTKLENGEEIDTNLFSKFDEILDNKIPNLLTN